MPTETDHAIRLLRVASALDTLLIDLPQIDPNKLAPHIRPGFAAAIAAVHLALHTHLQRAGAAEQTRAEAGLPASS